MSVSRRCFLLAVCLPTQRERGVVEQKNRKNTCFSVSAFECCCVFFRKADDKWTQTLCNLPVNMVIENEVC